MVAATSLGLAGTAHATITNDPGARHYKNWKCASQDNPDPLDPFFNYHKEEYWGAV